MEVVKAFTTNNLHTEITIKGTFDTPLFRASDIGEVLEINNIRTSITNFDETEKVVQNIITQGGTQQVTFLTEKGLYKILFKSRKQIAEQFQNWVCDVIKEIRLSGTYTTCRTT
jgi:prophage antirepressor-like protein